MTTREIEAYHSGYCWPATTWGDPDKRGRATVSIHYADGTWEEIFRIYQGEGPAKRRHIMNEDVELLLARKILEHLVGGPVTDRQVRALYDLPGHSLRRLEPRELRAFLQGELF
jgi:hypothetical protein